MDPRLATTLVTQDLCGLSAGQPEPGPASHMRFTGVPGQGGVPANLASADGHAACEANCIHRRGCSPLPTRESAAWHRNPKGTPASLGLLSGRPARGAESRPGGGA